MRSTFERLGALLLALALCNACVLPPDRPGGLRPSDAGASGDAAASDAAGTGGTGGTPADGGRTDARTHDAATDAVSAGDGPVATDARPGKPDGGPVPTDADVVSPDARPPARYRVEGHLVAGARSSTGEQFTIIGRAALGAVRSFGERYGVEGGLTLTCPEEASCSEAF
jgi:hypothetical protein